MKAVIDSDILIDYLLGHPEAKAEIERYSDPLFSIIKTLTPGTREFGFRIPCDNGPIQTAKLRVCWSEEK